MHPELDQRRAAIAELCRQHRIARLEVFGSAARGADFDAESDADFLVEFLPDRRIGLVEWDQARQALAELLQRRVDLVEPEAVRNPFVRREIERDRELLYAA